MAEETVFLGGLPFGMHAVELAAWLEDAHGIEAARVTILRKRNGWSKGNAAVALRDEPAASDAIAKLDGTASPNPSKHLVARRWGGAPLPPGPCAADFDGAEPGTLGAREGPPGASPLAPFAGGAAEADAAPARDAVARGAR